MQLQGEVCTLCVCVSCRSQLCCQVEKMRQDKPRSYYTERILDSVAKISKQRAEIEKVEVYATLMDVFTMNVWQIRNEYMVISKEVSGLEEKRDRIFTATDEQIFKVWRVLHKMTQNSFLMRSTKQTSTAAMRTARLLPCMGYDCATTCKSCLNALPTAHPSAAGDCRGHGPHQPRDSHSGGPGTLLWLDSDGGSSARRLTLRRRRRWKRS